MGEFVGSQVSLDQYVNRLNNRLTHLVGRWFCLGCKTAFSPRLRQGDGLGNHWGMAADLNPETIAASRRLTGSQKVNAAFQLYWTAGKIKAARLRQVHPDWTEQIMQQTVKEIVLHASC